MPGPSSAPGVPSSASPLYSPSPRPRPEKKKTTGEEKLRRVGPLRPLIIGPPLPPAGFPGPPTVPGPLDTPPLPVPAPPRFVPCGGPPSQQRGNLRRRKGPTHRPAATATWRACARRPWPSAPPVTRQTRQVSPFSTPGPSGWNLYRPLAVGPCPFRVNAAAETFPSQLSKRLTPWEIRPAAPQKGPVCTFTGQHLGPTLGRGSTGPLAPGPPPNRPAGFPEKPIVVPTVPPEPIAITRK